MSPANEDEEIYQNCKSILKTIRSTCPLHREFGLSIKSVDLPQPQALASLSQDIVTTFGKYEPRVKVIEIIPLSNNGDGRLRLKLKVKKFKLLTSVAPVIWSFFISVQMGLINNLRKLLLPKKMQALLNQDYQPRANFY